MNRMKRIPRGKTMGMEGIRKDIQMWNKIGFKEAFHMLLIKSPLSLSQGNKRDLRIKREMKKIFGMMWRKQDNQPKWITLMSDTNLMMIMGVEVQQLEQLVEMKAKESASNSTLMLMVRCLNLKRSKNQLQSLTYSTWWIHNQFNNKNPKLKA